MDDPPGSSSLELNMVQNATGGVIRKQLTLTLELGLDDVLGSVLAELHISFAGARGVGVGCFSEALPYKC